MQQCRTSSPALILAYESDTRRQEGACKPSYADCKDRIRGRGGKCSWDPKLSDLPSTLGLGKVACGGVDGRRKSGSGQAD